MIPEAIIEEQLAALQAGDFEQDLRAFAAAQPHLLDYLSGEDTGAFTPAEQELLFFAVLVIYRSIAAVSGVPAQVDGEKISAAEEANFALLQAQSTGPFRDRITPFFEQSSEEDLLAFIEDLLLDTEDETVSKEGREPLFVLLKTCVDTLL